VQAICVVTSIIIMYDNSVKSKTPISKQLRQRRRELGLSLSEVARRAGTSAATLSRYENGWTRFESYTLRKLATALGCELSIKLRPRGTPHASRPATNTAAKRLRRLFWDHRLVASDFSRYPVWVVERVLEYGNLSDIRTLTALMGRSRFLHTVADATRVSARTRCFWRQILEQEGIPCTKKRFRSTPWNC
jgi:transcriptional regulator with XRE-family HTH domain